MDNENWDSAFAFVRGGIPFFVEMKNEELRMKNFGNELHWTDIR